MKTEIQELIKHYTETKKEIWMMLEELSQVDDTKLSIEEKESLKLSIARLSTEYEMRGLIVSDLTNLL